MWYIYIYDIGAIVFWYIYIYMYTYTRDDIYIYTWHILFYMICMIYIYINTYTCDMLYLIFDVILYIYTIDICYIYIHMIFWYYIWNQYLLFGYIYVYVYTHMYYTPCRCFFIVRIQDASDESLPVGFSRPAFGCLFFHRMSLRNGEFVKHGYENGMFLDG
jgi:hypothetical protein